MVDQNKEKELVEAWAKENWNEFEKAIKSDKRTKGKLPPMFILYKTLLRKIHLHGYSSGYIRAKNEYTK